MYKKECVRCKHWIRIETGCFYGTCLKVKDGIWRCEGEKCDEFEARETGAIK